MNENDIIKKGIEDGVNRGRQIGHITGQTKMLTEVSLKFPDVPDAWVLQRYDELHAEMRALANETKDETNQ